MEKQKQQPEKHDDQSGLGLDSPINTRDAHDFEKRSLTQDERADVDPNKVPDKPSFHQEPEEKTDDEKFDGEIKI
ncbi:hypothetical protein FLLO111716_02545 [Flavobacterium longum]|uniref:hypothetical protein n=1 Tax=Flavobacterium longum TaxID=1299340 RepID=UPI0039E8C54D